MYVPAHFAETDPDVLGALVAAHPLGTWVTLANGEIVVNHVPFLLERGRGPHGVLVGHVARANPVWQRLSPAAPSVVVFQGADAYISPSWYPGKRAHGKVVPTWNYAVVHAHGIPRAIEDRAWLRALVTRLTDTHEAGHSPPWQVADAPVEYVDRMLASIVGIEIPVTALVGKWKISQNRSRADMQGVAAGLRARDGADATGMAALVEARVPAASHGGNG